MNARKVPGKGAAAATKAAKSARKAVDTAEKTVRAADSGMAGAASAATSGLYVEKRKNQRRRAVEGADAHRYVSKIPDKEQERRAFLRRKADLAMAKERRRDNLLWLAGVGLCVLLHAIFLLTLLMQETLLP